MNLNFTAFETILFSLLAIAHIVLGLLLFILWKEKKDSKLQTK